MNNSKTAIFIFLNFLIASANSASDFCPKSLCRRNEPIIRFPFHLQDRQPIPCGYPGFDLFCGAFNQTLIELPNSGIFTVRGIDYATQNIWLNDPNNCLAERILALNFSGSPFNGQFFQNFMFFNCTFRHTGNELNPIGCLSGDNYSVYASSSEGTSTLLQSMCSLVATVAVPVQWDFFEPLITSDLDDDIRLMWAAPRCRRCETRGGRCGFKSSNSTEIWCTNVGIRGLSRNARYALVACAGVPTFFFLVGFLCFLCNRMKQYGSQNNRIVEFSATVAPQPTNAIVSGLDSQIIESFPKTILGESCRLPKPDDNICSICLCEYMPEETLRSIPDCQHCFHAQCVDEWLQLNASCPVCRNSPMSQP